MDNSYRMRRRPSRQKPSHGDCQPGIAVVLHTWGQRMNLHVHVHVHVILTAGGLSANGEQWKEIDATHPVLSNDVLSSEGH